MSYKTKLVCFLGLMLLCGSAAGQKAKKKISFKDSVDGAFDLSRYITEADGLVFIPIIVTEPALGGFGGGLVPIYLKKRPPYIDSIKGKRVVTPVAPDLTGAAALYTANKTWVVGGFRSGTLVKSRIKYIIGGAYANVNLSYYRDLGTSEDHEFAFNFRAAPLSLQAIKRIGYSHWYAGFKYRFLKTTVKYVGDPLTPPAFLSDKERSSIVSQLGPIIELDSRDNIFTPNRGMKVHFDAICSDDILGSDYDYWFLSYYMYAYKLVANRLTAGLRIDGQQTFGDPPFYLKPYIDMRGVPAARYQGAADLLTEGELRWDLYKRWSVMLFGGMGKAFDSWSEFGDAKLIGSGGTGFRYLVAKDYKLRMGLDLAYGPDNTFAYYIVFGSTWIK